MLSRSIILGRKIIIPQYAVKNYHSPGGIPGEVLEKYFAFVLHNI